MYTNNFSLDIIAVEMQNLTRMGGWVVQQHIPNVQQHMLDVQQHKPAVKQQLWST